MGETQAGAGTTQNEYCELIAVLIFVHTTVSQIFGAVVPFMTGYH